MPAAARRNGRGVTREDLRDAITASTDLFGERFDSFERAFNNYRTDHDKWIRDRNMDIERRLANIETEIKSISERLDGESSTRRTIAAISTTIGAALGAVIGWLIAIVAGR